MTSLTILRLNRITRTALLCCLLVGGFLKAKMCFDLSCVNKRIINCQSLNKENAQLSKTKNNSRKEKSQFFYCLRQRNFIGVSYTQVGYRNPSSWEKCSKNLEHQDSNLRILEYKGPYTVANTPLLFKGKPKVLKEQTFLA